MQLSGICKLMLSPNVTDVMDSRVDLSGEKKLLGRPVD